MTWNTLFNILYLWIKKIFCQLKTLFLRHLLRRLKKHNIRAWRTWSWVSSENVKQLVEAWLWPSNLWSFHYHHIFCKSKPTAPLILNCLSSWLLLLHQCWAEYISKSVVAAQFIEDLASLRTSWLRIAPCCNSSLWRWEIWRRKCLHSLSSLSFTMISQYIEYIEYTQTMRSRIDYTVEDFCKICVTQKSNYLFW